MKLKSLCKFLAITLLVISSTKNSYGQEDLELLPIVENKLWGFIDTKGNVAIKPQFAYVGVFLDGLAVVQLEIGGTSILPEGKKEYKPSKFGYIDKTGTVVLKVPYDTVGDFVEGLAPVQIGNRYDEKYYYPGKYGFIDKTGKLVIEAQFDQVINYFSEGLAAVKVGKKWGFVDKSRKIVIQPQFDGVSEFSEGLAVAGKDKKWGYIDRTGNFVIKPQFVRARNFSDGMAQINTKMYGNWGYIDKTGKIVIPTKYNNTTDFIDGKAFVREFKKNAFIDYCINKKDEKLPLEECKRSPKEYPVSKAINGKKFFVDELGQIIFENKWDEFRGFSNGVALVFNRNKNKFWCGLYVPGWVMIYDACFHWGYIDKTGNYIWKQPELK